MPTVASLRRTLKKRGLPTDGLKAALLARVAASDAFSAQKPVPVAVVVVASESAEQPAGAHGRLRGHGGQLAADIALGCHG